jgi:hypothetical protein
LCSFDIFPIGQNPILDAPIDNPDHALTVVPLPFQKAYELGDDLIARHFSGFPIYQYYNGAIPIV